MTPTISVVMPAFNAAQTIERALNSVYAQTYSNITETIVVDGGSTDSTGDVVRRRFPDVRYVFQENEGEAASRNRGVAMAQGDYVAFLDADDEWFPNKLEAQARVLSNHDGLALVFCGAALPSQVDQTRGALNAREDLPWQHLSFRDVFLKPINFFYGPSLWLARRDVLIRTGGFDATMLASPDTEYLWRLTWLGYGVARMPALLAVYYESHARRLSRRALAWAEAMKTATERYVHQVLEGDCGWLTREEAIHSLKRRYRMTADVMGLFGKRTEALELLSEAAKLPGGDLVNNLRIALAPRFPLLYWSLRKVALRLLLR
jgi:glycosyltransferase involved in cell wall biosynthesis